MRTVVVLTSVATTAALAGGAAYFLTQGEDAPSAVVPTSAEARALLSDIATAAVAGDMVAVCALASDEDTCSWQVEAAPVVPTEVPTVTCEEEYSPGMPHTTGRILHVAGTYTDGTPYVAEFFVTSTRDGARAVTPAYWTAPTVQRASGTPASACA